MALPYRTTGSLCPAFASARLVSLAVKHAYAIALSSRCPTVTSVPSNSSVTLWEETAPVKLPTMIEPALASGAWRVALVNDQLLWFAPQDSGLMDSTIEPDASLGLKLLLKLIGPFAPDEML